MPPLIYLAAQGVIQLYRRKVVAESNSIKVNEYLADVQSQFSEKYEMFVKVRELFLNNDSGLVEDIKYGGLVFFDAKELIGGIFQYKKHISIEFSYGVGLSDPYSVLEGKGKLRRHIKIYTLDDVNAKEALHYINEAVVYRPE
jgi:hypothetical protein